MMGFSDDGVGFEGGVVECWYDVWCMDDEVAFIMWVLISLVVGFLMGFWMGVFDGSVLMGVSKIDLHIDRYRSGLIFNF